MEPQGPVLKLRPELQISCKPVKSNPPRNKDDDPALATIEALKKQSVVYLNSSVQIFRTGGGVIPPKPPSHDARTAQYVSDVAGRNKSLIAALKNEVQHNDLSAQEQVALPLSPRYDRDDSSDEESYSNGWDDFGSDDDVSDKVIEYICRRCGASFQSSSSGEYYFCPDCKPLSSEETPLPQVRVAQVAQQLHYAKYTCKDCGVQFYSKVGNYNLCEVCSGLHNPNSNQRKKNHAHFLKAAIQRAQQSAVPQKNFLQSLVPMSKENDGKVPTGAPESPFSWGYTRKECKVCGQDFYNRIENWSYCPRCVGNSSSLKPKKKKPVKKPDLNDSGMKFENQFLSIVDHFASLPVNIKVEGAAQETKSEESKDNIFIKKEPEEMVDSGNDFGMKDNAEANIKKEVSDSVTNGESKDHIKKERLSSIMPVIPFKFILYACRLCKKTFYSNLLDCYYCQVCCNANSITKRGNRGGDSDNEEERRIKELTSQEQVKEEKYDKYFCKMCGKEFYSSVGEWDLCNGCNAETNSSSKVKNNKIVSSFTRKNVTFNRYCCNICKNFFFSSRDDQDCCKKCTRIVQAMKTQTNSEDEEAKWENVVYAKYICKSCEKPFYSKVGEYYYCSECNPETKFMINNKKMLACAHCSFETHLKMELRRHLLASPRGTKRKCACRHCSATAEPLAEGEEEEVIMYECKKCDYSTRYKKSYKKHKQVIHKAKVQLYSCKHCKFQSCHKGRLKSHIMSEHEGLKVYQCEQCDYATRQGGRLPMHVAVVHYGETPFPCITCNSKFGTKALLKAHITAEHEPKVISCQKCEFSTTKRDQFKAHMISHRDNDVLKCAECDFATDGAQKLLEHLASVHGDKSSHKCPMCNFKTSQRRRLEAHIVSKHLNNSYKCNKCNFSSPDLNRLKRHSTFSHHRPKKYRKNTIIQHCPYCDYKVKQVKRFTDHVATLHPDEPPIEPVVLKKRRYRNRRRNRTHIDLIGLPMVEDAGSQDDQNGMEDESGNESYSGSESQECDESMDISHFVSELITPTQIDKVEPDNVKNAEIKNKNIVEVVKETDTQIQNNITTTDSIPHTLETVKSFPQTEEPSDLPDSQNPNDKSEKLPDNSICPSSPDKSARISSQECSPSPKRLRYECPDCNFKVSGRKELRDHSCSHD